MPRGSRAGTNAALRDLDEADRLVGAGDREAAVLESMSCSPASIMWAASGLPLAMILSAAMSSAVPPRTVEREPKVPVPMAMRSVSP